MAVATTAGLLYKICLKMCRRFTYDIMNLNLGSSLVDFSTALCSFVEIKHKIVAFSETQSLISIDVKTRFFTNFFELRYILLLICK